MAQIRVLQVLGTVDIGESEELSCAFDWSRYGTPATPAVTIELDSDGTDMSGTMLTGAPSINDTRVQTPLISGAVRGVRYRLKCTVTIAGDALGNVYQATGILVGVR